MDVVYFFRESAGVRIPFFDYDRNLFCLFVRSGGFWNKAQREFLFRAEAIGDQLKKVSLLFSIFSNSFCFLSSILFSRKNKTKIIPKKITKRIIVKTHT